MKLFITTILLVLSSHLVAQQFFDAQKSDPVIVYMNDGNVIKGIYEGLDEKVIFLNLGDAGMIPIPKGKILKIETIKDQYQKDQISKGNWAEGDKGVSNTLYSKYYITETALGLSQGESYYQNILLFGHIVSHGITDFFSLTLGTESISLFVGETPGLYVNAKVNSTSSGIINVAGGAIAGVAPSGDEKFGSFYGVVTLGDRENNVSGGVSYFYASGEGRQLFYQFGLMIKMSNRISFVLDNGVTEGRDYGFVPALRWKSDMVALDFGLATNFTDGAFPVAAAAIKF